MGKSYPVIWLGSEDQREEEREERESEEHEHGWQISNQNREEKHDEDEDLPLKDWDSLSFLFCVPLITNTISFLRSIQPTLQFFSSYATVKGKIIFDSKYLFLYH